MPNTSKSIALITGGSHGIGLEFAKELGRRGADLLIVALPGEELEHATAELQQMGINVHSLGLDLTAEGSVEKIFEWVKGLNISINILINNAGFGSSGPLNKYPLDFYRTMMALNNRTMVELTYLFVPMLKASSGKAHIMNMSSMEVALPLPYKAVYAATKAFAYNFSLSLRVELSDHNVTVSVVCPGPTLTNEGGLKRIESHGARAKLIVKTPDYTAKVAIPAMLKGKAVIIPGTASKFGMKVGQLLPTSWKMSLLKKMFSQYKEV